MRRWQILIALFMCFSTIMSAQSQSSNPSLMCEGPDVFPPKMAVGETCQSYLACTSVTDYNDATCYTNAFLELVEICEAEDRDNCFDRAVGYLVMFGGLSSSTSYHDQREVSWLAWNLDSSNINSVLEQIDEVVESVITNYALELARGVVLERMGDRDSAIEAYSYSIGLQTLNPLPYYRRGLLYHEQGNTDQAAQDFYNYSILASEDLLASFPTPIPPFSMPDNAEEWHLYGIIARDDTISGTFFNDLTVNPPIELTIAPLDEETIAVVSLMNISDDVEDDVNFFRLIDPEEALYYPYSDDARVYTYGRTFTGFYDPFYFGSNTPRSDYVIIEQDDEYELQSSGEGSESGSRSKNILLPSSEPDPRLALNRVCEGLPVSYLEVGDQLREIGNIFFVNFHEQPESEQFEPGLDIMTWWREANYPPIVVIDGPVCGEEEVWWQVTIDDRVWWIADEYYLLPERVSDVFYHYPLPTLDDLIELSNQMNPVDR